MFKKHLHTIMIAIAAILTISMFFCNMYITGKGTEVRYLDDLISLLVLIVSTIAYIVSFALTKFGFVQARVCIFNAIFLFCYQLILVWFYFAIDEVTFSPTVIFPLAAAILNALAGRRIMIRQVAYSAARALGPSANAKKKKK